MKFECKILLLPKKKVNISGRQALTIHSCSIPFRIKSSKVVVLTIERYLALPTIMSFSLLTTNSTVGVYISFGIPPGARSLVWITKQRLHMLWKILDVDHGKRRHYSSSVRTLLRCLLNLVIVLQKTQTHT